MWLQPLTSAAVWTSPAHCTAASIFGTLLAAIATKGLQKAEEDAKNTKDIVGVLGDAGGKKRKQENLEFDKESQLPQKIVKKRRKASRIGRKAKYSWCQDKSKSEQTPLKPETARQESSFPTAGSSSSTILIDNETATSDGQPLPASCAPHKDGVDLIPSSTPHIEKVQQKRKKQKLIGYNKKYKWLQPGKIKTEPDVEPKPQTKLIQDEYDVIIVGAGSAGCPLAARLSASTSLKVLLLEAGPPETEFGKVPALPNRYLSGPLVDWTYKTQPSGWDLGNPMARGKMLGGSSSVNAMHFLRGNAWDYEHWKKLGNEGWGYEDVLPYFRKAENALDRDLAKDTKYHGVGGPQDVQIDPFVHPNMELYMKGIEEMGLPRVRDVNGAKQLGVSLAPASVGHGVRRSTNTAYLKNIPPNLTVQTMAMVHRVVLSNDHKPKAIGVEFTGPTGRKRVVRARLQVVVSTGSYNSPQVLMLSGIGPKAHLKEAGIPVRVELPGVGKHLKDHMFRSGFGANFELTKTAGTGTVQDHIAAVKEYVERRSGPLSATVRQANLFLRTKYQPADDPRPDIQIPLGGSLKETQPDKSCASGEMASTFFNYLSWNAINIHPKSYGEILLNVTNPSGSPLIYHNVFGDESDLKPLQEAYKLLTKLNNTSTFQKNGIVLSLPIQSRCASETFDSDPFWSCILHDQKNGKTNGHPTSSCHMGPDSDPLAVVDAQLRVRGVDNLRVVDASVMPEPTSGNTNAVVIMIAEKAADIIKSELLAAKKQPEAP